MIGDDWLRGVCLHASPREVQLFDVHGILMKVGQVIALNCHVVRGCHGYILATLDHICLFVARPQGSTRGPYAGASPDDFVLVDDEALGCPVGDALFHLLILADHDRVLASLTALDIYRTLWRRLRKCCNWVVLNVFNCIDTT